MAQINKEHRQKKQVKKYGTIVIPKIVKNKQKWNYDLNGHKLNKNKKIIPKIKTQN